MGTISQPALLTSAHDIGDFNCGHSTLDDWLQKQALKNQDSGASRTFVITETNRVIGFYSLATGSVERTLATSNFSRNTPEAIPVIILARLAIDVEHQGQKLGSHLLKDALLRALSVSHHVGIRGILVHAITEKAKRFYQDYGFTESPLEPMTLLLSIKQLKTGLRD